jgi:toxin CcdB
MARFDVYRTRNGKQVVLDCQSDWLDYFDTRLVVPLVKAPPVKETSRLHPTLIVNGERMIMATQLASAVSLSELGSKLDNVANQNFVIMDALDMLISDY